MRLAPALLVVLGLAAAGAGSDAPGAGALEVALLASATRGDSVILPLAERRAVGPVVSFIFDRVAPEATSALALDESDRAALLRAENALARMGRPAIDELARLLPAASGARLQVLARALGRAGERAARDPQAARVAAEALASNPAVLVREHLLFSGRTTEPVLDEDLLPEILGRLATPGSLGTLLENEGTRHLGVRALAHARPGSEDAASQLSKLLGGTKEPAERRRIGRALSELGGEAAVLSLERALEAGPAEEHRDRIVEIEATRDPGAAPRVLARSLDRLDPEEQVRALEAISVCALPPPPPPKARFVADPFARRRSKDARSARAFAREAALVRAQEGPLEVRRAAARALEALGRPEDMKDQQVLAHRVLAAFEKESALAASSEEARALVELAPVEVLAAPFREALGRVLGAEGEEAGACDRFVHAVLSVLGDGEADVPLLVKIVAEGSLDPAARARAAAGLARLGAAGRSALQALGDSEDEIARACAKAALAGSLASDSGDLLFEGGSLGRSPRPLLRRANVAILAYAGGKAARGLAQGIARNDASPAVRLEGTEALARVYGRASSGVLAQALFDSSPLVRRAAARALERIGEPNVGGPLCQAIARAKKLPDPDQAEDEERTFREALATLGKDSVPSIGNIAINSGDPLERRVATAQLGRIATDEAIAYLMVIARVPKSPEDRDAAVWALERATGRDLTDSMWAPLRGLAR